MVKISNTGRPAPYHIKKQKTEHLKLKSALGYASKNGCKWDSNPFRSRTESIYGFHLQIGGYHSYQHHKQLKLNSELDSGAVSAC